VSPTHQPIGRRERKKAATRREIADTALRLFRGRGYETVGIREIAAEADVAVTTLFAHFPSKETLVFEQAADFETRLVATVAGCEDARSLVPALHDEVGALVRHCTSGEAAEIWSMIEESPELSAYALRLEVRYADALVTAMQAAPAHIASDDACHALARFAMAAFTLARRSATPRATLDASFGMIDAAWQAARRAHEE